MHCKLRRNIRGQQLHRGMLAGYFGIFHLSSGGCFRPSRSHVNARCCGRGRINALTLFQVHGADGVAIRTAAVWRADHLHANKDRCGPSLLQQHLCECTVSTVSLSSPPMKCSPISTTCAWSRCCVTQTQCSDTVLIAQRRQWLDFHRRGITVETHARNMYAGRLTCTAFACWEACMWYWVEPDAENIVLLFDEFGCHRCVFMTMLSNRSVSNDHSVVGRCVKVIVHL